MLTLIPPPSPHSREMQRGEAEVVAEADKGERPKKKKVALEDVAEGATRASSPRKSEIRACSGYLWGHASAELRGACP